MVPLFPVGGKSPFECLREPLQCSIDGARSNLGTASRQLEPPYGSQVTEGESKKHRARLLGSLRIRTGNPCRGHPDVRRAPCNSQPGSDAGCHRECDIRMHSTVLGEKFLVHTKEARFEFALVRDDSPKHRR